MKRMTKRIISEEMNNLKKAVEKKAYDLHISLKQACISAGITPSILRKIPNEGVTEENANKIQAWLAESEPKPLDAIKNAVVINIVTPEDLARMENDIADTKGKLTEMQNDYEYMQSVYLAQLLVKEKEAKPRKERIDNLTKEQEDAIKEIYEGKHVNKNLAILLQCTPGTITNAKNRAKKREEAND